MSWRLCHPQSNETVCLPDTVCFVVTTHKLMGTKQDKAQGIASHTFMSHMFSPVRIVYIYVIYKVSYIIARNTAQGGDGSFKNRKL